MQLASTASPARRTAAARARARPPARRSEPRSASRAQRTAGPRGPGAVPAASAATLQGGGHDLRRLPALRHQPGLVVAPRAVHPVRRGDVRGGVDERQRLALRGGLRSAVAVLRDEVLRPRARIAASGRSCRPGDELLRPRGRKGGRERTCSSRTPSYPAAVDVRRRRTPERARGIEPPFQAWEARVLTIGQRPRGRARIPARALPLRACASGSTGP